MIHVVWLVLFAKHAQVYSLDIFISYFQSPFKFNQDLSAQTHSSYLIHDFARRGVLYDMVVYWCLFSFVRSLQSRNLYRSKISLLMALLVVRSAGSGEVLAEFDGDEFQKMVETHGSTVRAVKLELKDKGFGCRFRQRLLNDMTEMQDDEMLVPPLDLKLVRLNLVPSDENENERFIVACGAGDLVEVEMRLKKPQDPNTALRNGWTGLHVAALNGHLEVVRLLLEAGALPDRDEELDARTPLHMAADHGHLEVVHLLLEARATVDRAGRTSETPLHLATESEQVAVVQMLLEARASCDQAGMNFATPLHLAAENGNVEVTRLLLNVGAACDKAAIYSETPLHVACKHGHVEVARLLLEARACSDLGGSYGLTPLDFALRSGDHETIRLLESAKAASKPPTVAVNSGILPPVAVSSESRSTSPK